MGVKVYTIGAGAQRRSARAGKGPVRQHAHRHGQGGRGRGRRFKKIADETGGKFFRATDTDSLKKIYAEIDRMEKTTQTVKKFEVSQELFALAVIPALGVARPDARPGTNPLIRRLP